MIQFYISTGLIVASLYLQMVVLINSFKLNRATSTNSTHRVFKATTVAENYTTVLKNTAIVTTMLMILTIVFVALTSELIFGIIYMGYFIVIIGLILGINYLFQNVGNKNEVQLANIKKVDFTFNNDESVFKKLKSLNNLRVFLLLIIGVTNTSGIIVAMILFEDSLLAGLVNLAITILAYLGLYYTMNKRYEIVFSNQPDSLSDEDVVLYIKKAKEEFRLSTKQVEDLMLDSKEPESLEDLKEENTEVIDG